MRSQLLEKDFYERFQELFDKISDLDPPVDLVVHSGDLYNSPWEGNPSQPPVVAQETAITVLQNFIEKTGIPVLIIEGNHGLYRLLEVSLLDSLKLSVPGLDVATQQDLKQAMRNEEPLVRSYDKLDIYCFPFMDPVVLRSADMTTVYDDWISTHQSRVRTRTSIAVAHGMVERDETLSKTIFSMDYDYIALGHDHSQREQSKGAWFAGSPERWRFDEIDREKGFLVVDVEAGSKPVVTPHLLDYERLMINENIVIEVDDSIESIMDKVNALFDAKGVKTAWNPKTAARIRLVFEGKATRVSSFDLGMALEAFRIKILSKDSAYNVVQFVWHVRQSVDEEFIAASYPEIESEYLIQDPEADFRAYLDTLEIEKSLDPSVLTKIAVRSLEHAVGTKEGKMNTESMLEGEK
ncbi:MAG: metallophosphoesterase family protein [Candidatus Thorarchaeota archaeon]|jgi:DNA repair exonuclease SbcCD nuclease subunit